MKTVLLVISMSFLMPASYAQPGRSQTQNAYERKYENENADNKAKGEAWLSGMMNGKTESQYSFPLFLNMHVTDYKNGEKKGENDMKYYINAAQNIFAMKVSDEKKRKRGDMFMIYDYKNNSMVMLNEEEKTGMAININSFMSADAQARRGQPTGTKGNSDCKKTGRTKMIHGYSCEEYVCTDEDRNRRSEIWITTKIHIDIAESGGKGPWASYFGSSKGLGGMMMEGDFYKNGQLEAKIEVTDVNEHADLKVSMSDYKMGMH